MVDLQSSSFAPIAYIKRDTVVHDKATVTTVMQINRYTANRSESRFQNLQLTPSNGMVECQRRID